MVKRGFFARLGIVQFVRGWLRRQRFISTLKECERLNKSARHKHIVVCLDGEPMIINKPLFKDMRGRGIFKRTSTWGQLCRWQVTRRNLDNFFTPNPEK